MGFTINEQKGCSEAFRGNANCAKHPYNDTNHVGTPRNVSRENMTWPGEFKNVPKKPKMKVIIHAFGFSRGPSFERHGMPPRGLGGHWKGVMSLGTKMWMPLRSFRCSFSFHEK